MTLHPDKKKLDDAPYVAESKPLHRNGPMFGDQQEEFNRISEPERNADSEHPSGAMTRLGLALSGGGFRATLYHLGVIRCLRDCGVLPRITHITTVSGGSIIGAHLALNWDRYCGTPEQFDEAASEIIRFTQLDVRNRIVRRFPLAAVANRIRSMLLLGPRWQWSRAGLLEGHYERFLYGDIPLSALPDHPRLQILSTNLSEGCLCSFDRNGLLVQRRVAGQRDRFERVKVGLATVPMAVAASSCFPGFFPPLELTGWDVGADVGEFQRQAFTDGGVYDNLGLRMFRCLEQSWVRHATPLQENDFLALDDVITALRTAEELPQGTPLRRLRDLISIHVHDIGAESASLSRRMRKLVVRGLWDVIRSEKLYRDPIFVGIDIDDPSAKSLLNYLDNSGSEPAVGDGLWLNRMIVEAVLRQSIGKRCLRLVENSFDGILVSDAGGKFKVNRDARGGGLISTAIRSSDILMDRVWQLESEVFENTSGVVFIPITDIVDPGTDAHAIDPEVQRQTSKIRTDLDRFSDVEVSCLVQHGYEVARQICRRNPSFVDVDPPRGAPWDPLADTDVPTDGEKAEHIPREAENSALLTARILRHSSKRKILTTLLNLRDWPSYVWLLLMLVLAIGVPYFYLERSERLEQQRTVLSAVAELNPDYERVVRLLGDRDLPEFKAMPFDTVDTMEEPDLAGFEVISESRVFDLRGWTAQASQSNAIGYSRTLVRRLPGIENNTEIRLQRELASELFQIDCRSEGLDPQLSRMDLVDGRYRWQLRLDLGLVPLNGRAEIITESILPLGVARAMTNEGRLNFTVRTNTGLLQVWLLMPRDREYDLFEVSSHPIGEPESIEVVVPAAVVRVAMNSVATFRLINPEPNRLYECRWTWSDATSNR